MRTPARGIEPQPSARSRTCGGWHPCTDENQASDLVRRLPFCEPIPPLTDRRNPQIRAAAHQNAAPRVMQLCNVSFRQPARAMRPDLPRSAESAVVGGRYCPNYRGTV